ncbi:MAG: cbb3-type cytochrome c oxidase subunit I, partial [candidate division NC10 bacterium]|nr:cbb3-type cytochrome c oxidase subunit I [candidate division NC10 bacterium]
MSDTTERLAKPAHRNSESDRTAKRVMWLYIGSGLALVGAMVVVGLGLRMAQGGMHTFQPGLFYSLMTLHGAAMMTGMALCGMGLLWYLFTQEGPLNPTTAIVACALILVGAVLVAISVLVGGFGAAWTFLYPLPFVGTYWPSWATGVFLAGIACVVLGWTIWCLQMLGGALTRYGGLRGALAWDLVWSPSKFAKTGRQPPPPQAFAVLVSAMDGLLAGSAGMLVGVALFARWLNPALPLDPLWVKNLTYI